jgi:hypothetical protein
MNSVIYPEIQDAATSPAGDSASPARDAGSPTREVSFPLECISLVWTPTSLTVDTTSPGGQVDASPVFGIYDTAGKTTFSRTMDNIIIK